MAGKKTLYHSELTKAGTFMLNVLEGPNASKYPDKPDYYIVEFNGAERLYNVESDQCSEFLSQWVGRGEFAAVAEGSRDDATIAEGNPDDVDQGQQQRSNRGGGSRGGSSRGSQQRQTTQRPSQSHRPPADEKYDPEKGVAHVRVVIGKAANIYLLALAGANYIKGRAKKDLGIDMTPEQFQACTSTLVIRANDSGAMNFIPSGAFPLSGPSDRVASKKAAPAEPAKPSTPPKEEAPKKPEPELPDDSDDVPF